MQTVGRSLLHLPRGSRCWGLSWTFRRVTAKRFFLGHTETEERAAELQEQLRGYIESGSGSPKDAERLRGRMLFYESFTFGRLAGAAVKSSGRFACGSRPPMKFDDDFKSALEFLLGRVSSAKPIVVTQKLKECWYIFTDGACDAAAAHGSTGGVPVSPQGKRRDEEVA